jgi:hypothetical protein
MSEETPKLDVRTILLWIMDNTNNEEAMNKISFAAFPYTTKYKTRFAQKEEDDGVYLGEDE